MKNFDTIAAQENWTDDTKLKLLGEFVEKTDRLQTFVDQEACEVADMENGAEDEEEKASGCFSTLVFEQGWNESSQITIILNAVHAAGKDDELAIFAQEKADFPTKSRKNRP